jgi:hypothetical protein
MTPGLPTGGGQLAKPLHNCVPAFEKTVSTYSHEAYRSLAEPARAAEVVAVGPITTLRICCSFRELSDVSSETIMQRFALSEQLGTITDSELTRAPCTA